MKYAHVVRNRRPRGARADHGTPERAQQLGGLVREAREIAENGRLVARTGMRAKAECALDALLLAGALGEGADATRRHKAGEWLRALYISTHPTRTAMSWEMRGRDQSEMSDQTAWNIKCLTDTLRQLGKLRAVTEAVCCDDRAVSDVATLQQGLDLLADERGL